MFGGHKDGQSRGPALVQYTIDLLNRRSRIIVLKYRRNRIVIELGPAVRIPALLRLNAFLLWPL